MSKYVPLPTGEFAYTYDSTTMIQTLLDIDVMCSNTDGMTAVDIAKQIFDIRIVVINQLIASRSPAPDCYGEDDCSANILAACPWRITCGS